MYFFEEAILAVRKAGELLLSMTEVQIEEKTDYKNLVTTCDKAVQEYLVDKLGSLCPEASFLCEEDDLFDLSGKYLFIVDPIDGTANFTKQYSMSAISVAFSDKIDLLWGIVYNPFTGELFSAQKGKGAYLNDKPISVTTEDLQHSLVNLGTTPYYREAKEETFRIAAKLMDHCMDIRRTGSAALDLCYASCGRCGLYFEMILSPWDFAAGMCILKEAGGVIQNWDGLEPDFTSKSGIIAGSSQNVDAFSRLFCGEKLNRKKLLFVYNPVSGKRIVESNMDAILSQMADAGYEITSYATSGPGEATDVIACYGNQYDRVVVAGGDGTLQEAVNAVKNTDMVLGYIPAGSTNDFASSLGIKGHMKDKIQIALSDKVCKCDIGQLNDKIFLYVACFGTLSDISYTASQELKNRIGHAAYVVKGFQSFHGFDSLHLTVTYDDQIIDGEFCYGMITNSKYTAGVRLNYAKDVLLDDGLFEVVLIRKPHNPNQFRQVATDMIVPSENPNMIVTFQTSKLHIQCDTPIPMDLDGEYGGTYTDIDFSVQNQAASIVCGETEDSDFVKLVEQRLLKSQFKTDTNVNQMDESKEE